MHKPPSLLPLVCRYILHPISRKPQQRCRFLIVFFYLSDIKPAFHVVNWRLFVTKNNPLSHIDRGSLLDPIYRLSLFLASSAYFYQKPSFQKQQSCNHLAWFRSKHGSYEPNAGHVHRHPTQYVIVGRRVRVFMLIGIALGDDSARGRVV